MSKLNTTSKSNGGNSNSWQEQADKAWKEAEEIVEDKGFKGYLNTIKSNDIRETEFTKGTDGYKAMEKASAELIEKLFNEKALIVGGKTGGGLEVKQPKRSIYKDSLTIEFGRAKANKDAEPMALKAVIDKDGQITGVYVSTETKEMQGEKGTFTIPTKFRRYEAVENIPASLKTLIDAIGFKNPEREQSNDGKEKIELPDKADKFFSAALKKLGELNKTAPTATVERDGKNIEVKQYQAYVQEGVLSDKGNFDGREGVSDANGKAYRINISDHAQDGQNKFSVDFDKDGNVISGTLTDFGSKNAETGRYDSMFRTNVNLITDANKDLGICQIVKAGLDGIEYQPPKYEKDSAEKEAPEQEEQEVDEHEIPFV